MSTRTDSVLVGAYLPFPLRLGPDVTVESLAVRIGAAIQSAVDECERRQAMRIADAVAEEREACADAASQDVQAIVTSLGNIESTMAEQAPESFCAAVSNDYARAMRCAMNIPKRIRARGQKA